MGTAKDLLRDSYLAGLKDNPKLYIGVEFELPIVNEAGQAADLALCQGLLAYLANQDSLDMTFEPYKYDKQGHIVELLERNSGDHILFEVSYTTLEFAFAKADNIAELEGRFESYLELIQPYLASQKHSLQGHGINPNWQENANQAISLDRYEMLLSYLSLSKAYPELHDFPNYGAFICGSQVQMDVSSSNYLRVINAFNRIEAAKAYLFANSSFDGADWDSQISRDIFWEQSMHGLIPENVGVFPHDFKTDEDFLAYLAETAIFVAEREGQVYYFPPIKVKDYLDLQQVEAYDLSGQKHQLIPSPQDFEYHRAYHYQALTRRGTVEFRSVCAQPLDRSFEPIAFHLGLMENLAELEAYLEQAPIFDIYGQDLQALRRLFSQAHLNQSQTEQIRDFTAGLLDLAQKGLEARGLGEESHLSPLRQRFDFS